METLLDQSDLDEIYQGALDAGLALAARDALFMGIDNAVRSMIYSRADTPADALKIELGRLNSYVNHTETNGYHFAVWLKNAADRLDANRPPEAQFFRNMAAKVAAIPPRPPRPITAVSVIDGARAEEQSNQKVKVAVEVLRGSMPGIGTRATNLLVSKRVHDALHHIQLNILPLWNKALGVAESDPGLAEGLIAAQLRQLADKTDALPRECSILQPNEPLRLEAQATSDRLAHDCQAAEAALAGKDTATLRSVMERVADTVKGDMPLYAERMENYRGGLDLALVGMQLTVMAEDATNAALRDDAGRLASKLGEIVQDLNVIGPRHSQWQRLDERLVSTERLFGFLMFGPAIYSAFNLEWDAVDRAIASLSASLPPDRFDRVTTLRDGFLAVCPVPVTIGPPATAAEPFASFVTELRTVFQRVDSRLLDICNQLREVTSQLAQL